MCARASKARQILGRRQRLHPLGLRPRAATSSRSKRQPRRGHRHGPHHRSLLSGRAASSAASTFAASARASSASAIRRTTPGNQVLVTGSQPVRRRRARRPGLLSRPDRDWRFRWAPARARWACGLRSTSRLAPCSTSPGRCRPRPSRPRTDPVTGRTDRAAARDSGVRRHRSIRCSWCLRPTRITPAWRRPARSAIPRRSAAPIAAGTSVNTACHEQRRRRSSSASAATSAKPRLSVGAGVNWNSPFGPLRIDVAYALLKNPSDDTKLITFNVGTQF